MIKRTLFLAILFAVCACSESSEETPTPLPEEGCDPRIPATGSEVKIPHPIEPSECSLILLRCNYCKYDANGALEKTGFEVCGACFISETE